MNATYDDDSMREAQRFEDFVYAQFMYHMGICVQPFRSQFGQYNWGENSGAIECKFDKRWRDTGNLYIEVAEKSRAENKSYVPSGIFTNPSPFLYVIGDETRLFVFCRRQLETEWQLKDKDKPRWERKQTPTSRGFVLPVEYAFTYAAAIVDCHPDDVPSFIRRSNVTS